MTVKDMKTSEFCEKILGIKKLTDYDRMMLDKPTTLLEYMDDTKHRLCKYGRWLKKRGR